MAVTDMTTVDQRTQAMAGNAPPAATEATGAPSEPGMVQQASPEEQQLYNAVVGQAFNMIYDRKFLPTVIDMLKGNGDPVEGLATAAAQVTARVAKSAKQSGRDIPPDVLLHAATEVFEDLAELSRTAGIKDYSQDQDAFEGAYFRALDQYRVMEQQSGGVDQRAAQQDLAKLQQMDQSGELEQMLMGLAENDPRSAKGGPKEERSAPAGGLMQGKGMN